MADILKPWKFKNNGKFPHPNNNSLNQKMCYAEYRMRQIDNVGYSYPCATTWKVMGELKIPNGRSQGGKHGRSGHGDEMQTIFVPATIQYNDWGTPTCYEEKRFNFFTLTPYKLQNESTLVHSTVTQCASFTLCP